MSFGFKYGLPNANYYFDVGFIKNPARREGWNFFSEVTDEMRSYVLSQPEVLSFIELVVPLISFLENIDQKQVFAFGCNAGRHRSRVLVDHLGATFFKHAEVIHRDG